MDITRRCDYACRILRSAYVHAGSYVSIADIAEKEGVPYSFARSIQHDLVKAGYLKTARGVRGGFTLDCDPKKVTVEEVVEVLQGPIGMAPCSVDCDYCECSSGCEFNAVWCAADKLVAQLFSSITLADLFEKGADHPEVSRILSAQF
jgi:Rrf2 family protein